MQRYVVLAHDWPSPHYDLMLEEQRFLKTWRIPQWPLVAVQQGKALPDHRLAYLEYEGQLSNNRGTVRRVAAGTYHTLQHHHNHWVVSLTGAVTGKLTIQDTGASAQLVWQEDGTDVQCLT